MYEKFSPVKVYYDFVFNPKEEALLEECKLKISNEYFPVNVRRSVVPKMRRSVAQKYMKHFILLGVDPFIIADVMLYNIEIAQIYTSRIPVNQELFYKSMFNSFEQAVNFIISNGISAEFKSRINQIYEETTIQKWKNKSDFEVILDKITF